MKIRSFALTNCLGFSKEGLTGQGIAEAIQLRDFNLIIGKNDSGKSTVVKAMVMISKLLTAWLSRNDISKFKETIQFTSVNTGYYEISQLNLIFHNKEVVERIEYEIEYKVEEGLREKLYAFSSAYSEFRKKAYSPDEEDRLIFKGFINHDQGAYWFHVTSFDLYRKTPTESTKIYSSAEAKFEKDINKVEYQPLLEFLHAFAGEIQGIVYVEPIRNFKDMNFQNAIERSDEKIRQKLNDLKEGDENQFKQFSLFEKFVLELTQDGKAGKNRRMVFPRTGETGISNDKNVLPLSSYGTGIEQLSTMAAHTVMHGTHRLMIIEEPEAHLHPDLQRRFFQYLIDNQINDSEKKKSGMYHQYIILSHSSLFINAMIQQEGQIFRAYKKNPSSNQTMLVDLGTEGTSKTLDDLGAKGSDILQSNGVIWLEGPSDRIYLKHWLELYANDKGEPILHENTDYSVAFYGGSILTWFGMEDEVLNDTLLESDTKEFINLLKLNRNAILLMDKDTPSGGKWGTKQKIKSELEKPEFPKSKAFLTKGKEVENYLIKDAIERVFPGLIIPTYAHNSDYGFNSLLVKKTNSKGEEEKTTVYERNKTSFAQKICEVMTIDDLGANSELNDLISEIDSIIRSWAD